MVPRVNSDPPQHLPLFSLHSEATQADCSVVCGVQQPFSPVADSLYIYLEEKKEKTTTKKIFPGQKRQGRKAGLCLVGLVLTKAEPWTPGRHHRVPTVLPLRPGGSGAGARRRRRRRKSRCSACAETLGTGTRGSAGPVCAGAPGLDFVF